MTNCSIIIRTNGPERLFEVLDGLGAMRAKHAISETLVLDMHETDALKYDLTRRRDPFPLTYLRYPDVPFSYGKSLNILAEHARSEVMISLSGHSIPADPDWLEGMLEPFANDPNLAGVCGGQRCYDFSHPLEKAYRYLFYHNGVTASLFRPFNMTNSAFRRSAWADLSFDENVAACEDKLWALHQKKLGRRTIVKPDSWVYHSHRGGFIETAQYLLSTAAWRTRVHLGLY